MKSEAAVEGSVRAPSGRAVVPVARVCTRGGPRPAPGRGRTGRPRGRSCLVRVTVALGFLSAGSIPAAEAADLTYVPPMLRGDVLVGYRGGADLVEIQDRADLQSPWLEVGRYDLQRHGMELAGTFSAWHGLAVRLSLPVSFHERLNWDHAAGLLYDPDADRPIAVGAPLLDEAYLDASPSSRVRRGAGDLGIGLRFVPFAERGVPGRSAPASMALDFDVLLPSGGSPDKVRGNGSTGPGAGGAQVRAGLSASRRLGGGEPWVQVVFLGRAPYRVDLSSAQAVQSADVDDDGMTSLDPGDELRLRFGAEIVVLDDPTEDASVRLDAMAGVTYRGPYEVSSGTRMPAPLDPTLGHRAVTSEHVVVETGVGLRIRPRSQVELRIDFAGGWVSPHTLERVDERSYTVQTGPGSFEMSWGMGALVRVR